MSLKNIFSVPLYFNEDSNRMKCDPWSLTLGAILSATNGEYVNSIESRRGTESKDALKKMWGITDYDTFQETASWLMDTGHRTEYQEKLNNEFKPFITFSKQLNGILQLVTDFFPRFGANYYHYKNNVRLYDLFADYDQRAEADKVLTDALSWSKRLQKNDIGDIDNCHNLLAWDAVRLANISRWALLANYIDYQTFEGCCTVFKTQLQADYNSWQELAFAYLVGGLIWDGTEYRADKLISGANLILKDPNSPYLTVPFK